MSLMDAILNKKKGESIEPKISNSLTDQYHIIPPRLNYPEAFPETLKTILKTPTLIRIIKVMCFV